jgi:hypothetical protein
MRPVLVVSMCAGFLLLGCAQNSSIVRVGLLQLAPKALEQDGIAFITPSTVTGQEQEKQAVALAFANILKRDRPNIRCVTLPETLSAINAAGLAREYRAMYADYRDTGLFKRDTLARVGKVTGARYLAQLKLQGFSQGEKERFGALGIRILDTQQGTARVFFQIWDAETGAIVWEGTEELRIASEVFTQKPITLTQVMEKAAEDLIARLP